MDNSIIEVCPHCGREIEMVWDVEELGYKAYCPVCGNRLMLCDECMHCDGVLGCDYNSHTDTCRFNRGEMSARRRHELFDEMLGYLKNMVSGDSLKDTLRKIGFTEAEIHRHCCEDEGYEEGEGEDGKTHDEKR